MISDMEGWVSWAQRRVKSDLDVMLAVVGEEGAGKSTFAYKLARKLDPSFDASRMEFAGPLYVRHAKRLRRGQAIVWDEVTEGGMAVDALTKENKEVLKFLVTCRALNLFHIACVPTLDIFSKYAREWRSPWYADVTNRGRVVFHQAVRASRRPGAKTYWKKGFDATFGRAEGEDWDDYLRRKEEWVRLDRDADAAVELEDRRGEGEARREKLRAALEWLPGAVVRGR